MRESNDIFLVEKTRYIAFLIFSGSTDEAIYISSSPELEPSTCPKENNIYIIYIITT